MIVVDRRAQALDALDRANWIRSRRKRLKRDIGAGRWSAVAEILNPSEFARTMSVIDLVLAMPKIGRGKAQKALRAAGVAPSRQLGALTDRQRRAVVGALPGWARTPAGEDQ